MSYLLVRDVVDQSVVNTTAERSVLSYIIPPGLWPGNVILLEQTGRYNNGNSSGRSFIVRLRLNGQQVTKVTKGGTGSTTSWFSNSQRWVLVAIGTNQVRAMFRWTAGGAGSDTGSFTAVTGPGGGSTHRYADQNTLSTSSTFIDLSKPVGLDVTVELNVATATHEYVSMGIWGELVTNDLTPAARRQTVTKLAPLTSLGKVGA
jgi:hypothetical protein